MGAKIAGHAQALGEIAIDCIAQAGNEKNQKRDLHLARCDRPHDDRHQKNAADGNKVGKVQDSDPGSSGATTLITRTGLPRAGFEEMSRTPLKKSMQGAWGRDKSPPPRGAKAGRIPSTSALRARLRFPSRIKKRNAVGV